MSEVYNVIRDMELYVNSSCVTAKPYSKYEYVLFKHGYIEACKTLANTESGYIIQHPDGTITWQNTTLFNLTHKQNKELTFGLAIICLEQGWKLKHKLWDSTDYIELRKNEAGDLAIYHIYFSKILDTYTEFPYVPSQKEMLSNEWEVVPESS